jgi:ribonuclease D
LKYKFIESVPELKSICKMLSREKIIGVDLEADSMHSFKEKICLIQIATDKEAFLIDPFEFNEITPFADILSDKRIIKVFHGADYDIRSLDRDYGASVQNLFDTEIATRFLGVKERGLAALLNHHFGVQVNKKYQREDWSQRPLKGEMIAYSVLDVAYLVKLYSIISDRLKSMDRLEWAKEEFDLQAGVRYENGLNGPLFRNFKGAGRLDNRRLAILENLLQLRMTHAEKRDLPMFKVLSNASIKQIAEEKICNLDEMVETRALSPKQAKMYGRACVKEVTRALKMSHGDLPAYPRTKRPKKDPVVQARIKRLKKLREEKSEAMNIEPGFLLNNAVIHAIAVEKPANSASLMEIDQIRKWQVNVLGNDILKNL